MGFTRIKRIPAPEELIDMLPMTNRERETKKARDEKIRRIFTGLDKRTVLVVGPCSADNEESVCDYVARLATVQERVEERILIIPRIYTAKPRTTGKGYKGMLSQPNPNEEPNVLEGIIACRKMHIRVIKESGLTPADELLYPEMYPYLEDLLSYIAVGARSVENQYHRLVASGIDVPVGMKNPTSGSISSMLDSIQASQMSHIFKFNDFETVTSGNTLAHAIIRGMACEHRGYIANYHYEDLCFVCEQYLKRKLENPAVIVDASHANSAKRYYEQPRIALEVFKNRQYSNTLKTMIKGIMIESYILAGATKPNKLEYGKSITDPCLGWNETEKLIFKLAELS